MCSIVGLLMDDCISDNFGGFFLFIFFSLFWKRKNERKTAWVVFPWKTQLFFPNPFFLCVFSQRPSIFRRNKSFFAFTTTPCSSSPLMKIRFSHSHPSSAQLSYIKVEGLWTLFYFLMLKMLDVCVYVCKFVYFSLKGLKRYDWGEENAMKMFFGKWWAFYV